jgi:hypothetical protein
VSEWEPESQAEEGDDRDEIITMRLQGNTEQVNIQQWKKHIQADPGLGLAYRMQKNSKPC